MIKMLSKDQQWLVKEYVAAIKDKRAALFIGSGISISAGFEAWENLLKRPAERLGLNIDEEIDNLPELAQWYVNCNGGNRTDLHQAIINAFVKPAKMSTNHTYLSELPVDVVWTTNYDTLLETAYGNRSIDVKVGDNSLANQVQAAEATIFKIHGTVSESGANEIIICSDDYASFSKKYSGMWNALLNHLISKNFLFLGYSFRDPNIRSILYAAKDTLSENMRHHYFVQKRETKERNKIQQELWSQDMRRFGIETILIDNYDEISLILKAIIAENIRDSIFVTGSHLNLSTELKEFVFELGKLIARDKFYLIYAQSEGTSKMNAFGFLEELIVTQQEFIKDRIELYPYLYNPDSLLGSDKKDAIVKLKRAMIRRVGTCVSMAGGPGTAHELEIAETMDRRIIPVGKFGGTSEIFLKTQRAYLEKYLKPGDIELLGSPDITPSSLMNIIKVAARES